jgi:peptide-methionine (S)-S-oxide reductase
MNQPVSLPRDIATLAGGCFWCLEAVYDHVQGVDSVESGYMGGTTQHPTYEQVCGGTTGHAEAVRITFDPARISYRELLEIFFAIHDPTTLNRQGNDVGTQYRSVIFFHTPEQQRTAAEVIAAVTNSGLYPNPIVTEIRPAAQWYEAEAYHQEYFARNPYQGYCSYVVGPKVAKFRRQFAAKLKPTP